MASIVKIRDLRLRPPEHGRIRFGKKTVTRNGKERPTAIETWRFTSPDREAIEQLAELYGGRCEPWHDPKASPQHQFQVETDAGRIQVWMAPNDSYTVQYEQWGGKGIERRCDGETCTFYGIGGAMERPCVCESQPEQTCKPYSRLNVILPQIRFGGVWRLEVKGQAFAHEAPGMIEAILAMQQAGMARVDLLLTKRTARDDSGQLMHFVVPQISVSITPEEMLQGLGQVQQRISLEHPSRLAIAPAPFTTDGDDSAVMGELIEPSVWHRPYDDDDAEDAELVDLLERSVAKVAAEKLDGWDTPPPDVRVKRNLNPGGPKWIRA